MQIKQLRHADRYVLHAQENADEVQLWKAEINPSITKKGISATFKGLEHLTAVGPLGGVTRQRGGCRCLRGAVLMDSGDLLTRNASGRCCSGGRGGSTRG